MNNKQKLCIDAIAAAAAVLDTVKMDRRADISLHFDKKTSSPGWATKKIAELQQIEDAQEMLQSFETSVQYVPGFEDCFTNICDMMKSTCQHSNSFFVSAIDNVLNHMRNA